MATAEEDRPMDAAISDADVDASPRDVAEIESLKRKASRDDEDATSPKRARHGDDASSPIDRRSRRDSPPSRRGSHGGAPNIEQDRRKSATQEERKRGKRLFGGLLSTLSQTSGNSQQKRRLEIERRQQERLQKQKVEDDKERAEKRARLTEIRMSEQIVFEEEVMRNKHSKILTTARFLKTKSSPHIFYLPWKLTPEQEDEIDEQVRSAKATVERESDAFEARKQRRDRDLGQPARSAHSATPEKPPVPAPPSDASVDKPARGHNGIEPPTKAPDKPQNQHAHHHHDESADVLEEAEEDMVIY